MLCALLTAGVRAERLAASCKCRFIRCAAWCADSPRAPLWRPVWRLLCARADGALCPAESASEAFAARRRSGRGWR